MRSRAGHFLDIVRYPGHGMRRRLDMLPLTRAG